MREQRTLCWRCANDYKEAGYNLERDYSVKTKEPCDKCGRMGWTYKNVSKEKEEYICQVKQ